MVILVIKLLYLKRILSIFHQLSVCFNFLFVGILFQVKEVPLSGHFLVFLHFL